MAIYSRITGTGSYFPPKVMTNHDFEKFLDTSDEWITTRTGIKQRHIAEGESCSDLGTQAAKKAIEMAGIDPNELDGIICATFTPDTTMPSTGCRIQTKLGITSNCFAYDIAAACSGFIYACQIANSMITSGAAKKILIVGAEKLSSIVNWQDRGTCILFGDGAGAFVMEASEEPGIRSIKTFANGAHGDLLKLDALGTEFIAAYKDSTEVDFSSNMIQMSGNEVFKIAVRAMADAAVMAVEDSGLKYEDIEYLVPHQANLRIIDATAKRLKLPSDKVVVNLDKYGNTSSATIPTAFDGAVRDGRIKKGTNVACAAFGGGLTWGSIVLTF